MALVQPAWATAVREIVPHQDRRDAGGRLEPRGVSVKPLELPFETKQRIRLLLRSYRGAWVKRDKIVEQLGIPDNAFRAGVVEMIRTGDPIVSSFVRGYSWADDPAVIEKAAAELEAKARALHVRIAALRSTAQAMRSQTRPAAQVDLPMDLHGLSA
jgi:hypothetical protein